MGIMLRSRWTLLVLGLHAVVSLSKKNYDYIVVGSGPGGATAARYLSENKKNKVLVLEAGDDHDEDDLIMDADKAPGLLAKVAQYHYIVTAEPNPKTDRDDAYITGRLLGGGSSVNGLQWVRPTNITLAKLVSAAKDPDWSMDNLFLTLKEVETFSGVTDNPNAHGYAGPINVRVAPQDPNASGGGTKFVNAISQALNVPIIQDYNNPTTPIGAFKQWQISSSDDGMRSSASTGMLSPEVRARKNLWIKVRSTVTYVNFDGTTATGVEALEDGKLKKYNARKGVVLAAGIRTCLILENSGVGNATKIQGIVESAGRTIVSNLPGVGEGLNNDGYVVVTLKRNKADPLLDPSDLYAGGAFLYYPKEGIEELERNNATACTQTPARRRRREAEISQRSLHGDVLDDDDIVTDPLCLGVTPGEGRRRLSSASTPNHHKDEEHRKLHIPSNTNTRMTQLIGTETNNYFRITALHVAVGSKGNVHIQSGDPLTVPIAFPGSFTNSHDPTYWCGLIQYQLQPVVKKILEMDPTMELVSPTLEQLGGNMTGMSCRATLGWLYSTYGQSHHWAGQTKLAARASNGVVDSSGKVYGTNNLWIADNSILPVKPDGNTQTYAYLTGATIAKKILKAAAAAP